MLIAYRCSSARACNNDCKQLIITLPCVTKPLSRMPAYEEWRAKLLAMCVGRFHQPEAIHPAVKPRNQ